VAWWTAGSNVDKICRLNNGWHPKSRSMLVVQHPTLSCCEGYKYTNGRQTSVSCECERKKWPKNMQIKLPFWRSKALVRNGDKHLLIVHLCNKQRRLVGWWSLAVVKGSWALCHNVYEVYVVITVTMVWWSFAVKEFWALWDNINCNRCHGNAANGGLLCTCTTTQRGYYNLFVISYLILRYRKSYYVV
jgi:hypothetical protein